MQTLKVKREKRADVAAAIVSHVLLLTKGIDPVRRPVPGCDLYTRKALGSFSCMHCVPLHPPRSAWDVSEMIDVWMQGAGKVFSAQRLPDEDWKACTFKRGDWESAFLMTQ